MTSVYITIDTEYSSGLVGDLSEAGRRDNFARSLACITPHGPAGVTHQLDVFARHGIKAVFFVDPMPALIWGVGAIEDIVAPILEAGQDVQLHCHTEWLAIAGAKSPLSVRREGRNLFDFSRAEQTEILEYARDILVAAGAPKPVAFRAGNYGANGASRISLGANDRDPVVHEGVIEVPVGSIGTWGGGQRHAQITALSFAEMHAAIRHAHKCERPSFTLVTHSFELINRRKQSVNRIVHHRFEKLCAALAKMDGVQTANYRDNPPQIAPLRRSSPPLPASALRTSWRYAEQLASNTLYGAL